jgi:hypothetical protein
LEAFFSLLPLLGIAEEVVLEVAVIVVAETVELVVVAETVELVVLAAAVELAVELVVVDELVAAISYPLDLEAFPLFGGV